MARQALVVSGSGSQSCASSGANVIADSGLGSIGLYALAGGVINATGAVTVATTGGVSVTTTGLPAYGVNADGAGSQINLAGATTVTTAGTDAYGLYASNGGLVTAPDGPSVTTTRPWARSALYASGAGSSVTAGGGATILTEGAAAPAAEADTGGLMTLNGASLATSGTDSHALEVSGIGSRASLGGANSFSTSGLGSIGLYALGGGVINASGPDHGRDHGIGFGLDRPSRLRCQRRRRGFSGQPRCGDDHDNRRGRGRSLRQRCDGHGSRRGDCGFGTARH